MRRGVPRAFVLSVLWTALAFEAAACNLDNPGDNPVHGKLYFPNALALSASSATQAPRFLYVVNANFDLRYNAGTVQAYDLDTLDAAITKKCAKHPGQECEIPSADVIADEVWIPSFSTGVAVAPDHKHLYVVARADASLTVVDLNESAGSTGILSCSSNAKSEHCDAGHHRGDDSVQNARRLRMPGEPVAVITGPASDLTEASETPIGGDFVMVAHRAGQLSLFLEAAETSGGPKGSIKSGPVLTDVVDGLAQTLTGLAFDPFTHRAYMSVLDVDAIDVKALDRVGVAVDPKAPEQSFLYDAGPVALDGVSYPRDTRAVAFRNMPTGTEAVVVSQEPAALLWVDIPNPMTDSDPGHVPTRLTVDVGAGPSRVTLGNIGTVPVAAVSCFQGKQIFIVHAQTGAVLSIVHNLSGPFEIALDSVRQRLYVADFRTSVVRILDVSPVATMGAGDTPTSASVIATLGSPKQVQELQ